jgi:hypothetical protein
MLGVAVGIFKQNFKVNVKVETPKRLLPPVPY